MSQPTTSAGKSAGFLTLKYGGAVALATAGLFAAMGALPMLFQLWTGSAYAASAPVTSILSNLGLIGNHGVVFLSVGAVVFSLLAFFLYRRVTKDVAVRPEYVNSTPYVFITNAFVGVVAFAVLAYAVDLLTILISSLLLIGKGDIGGMYLNQFLPNLLAAGLAVFTGIMGYKIASGKNMSFVMTLVMLSVAGALLIATCITVPIKGYTSGGVNSNSIDWESILDNADTSSSY